MTAGIDEIAQRLLRAGHVDNEPDARLAAVLILLTSEARTPRHARVAISDADPHDDAAS